VRARAGGGAAAAAAAAALSAAIAAIIYTARLGQAKAGPGDPLVMEQFSHRRIGQGGMGEQHLPGGKGAGIGLVDIGPGAKEGDLEAHGQAPFSLDPAGHVPPLGAKRGVCAMVAGKGDGRPGRHGGIDGRHPGVAAGRHHQQGHHAEAKS
jgi:hypothetical protein